MITGHRLRLDLVRFRFGKIWSLDWLMISAIMAADRQLKLCHWRFMHYWCLLPPAESSGNCALWPRISHERVDGGSWKEHRICVWWYLTSHEQEWGNLLLLLFLHLSIPTSNFLSKIFIAHHGGLLALKNYIASLLLELPLTCILSVKKNLEERVSSYARSEWFRLWVKVRYQNVL